MLVPKQIKASQFTYRIKKQWGQIYWFDFGEASSGQRTFAEVHPALIISNPQRTLPGTVLITPFTGFEHKRPNYEFHVDIPKAECPELDKDSVFKIDQIFCVEDRLLPDQYYIGELPELLLRKVYSKLIKVLNFDIFAIPKQ